MTIWVFPGENARLSKAIDEGQLPISDPMEIPADSRFAVYLTDEDALVGPFKTPARREWTPEQSRDRIPFEVPVELYRADIATSPYREKFSEGGRLEGRFEDIVETKLNSASELFDTPEPDSGPSESEDDSPKSLLDISKAPEPVDAAGADFSGEAPKRVSLDRNDFREADFRYADLEGASFADCDLRGADFTGANLRDASFLGAKLERTDFSDAKLHDATFDGKLSRCHFEGAVMEGTDLRKATLQEADFSGVHMPDAKLQGTRPANATFDHSNLVDIKTDSRTNFEDASFRDAILDGTVLSGCNLNHADFEGASLVDANLSEPGLDYSSFTRANLRGAKFQGQTIDRPDFTGANLADAHFEGCTLDDARFHGARLDGADLRGADIQGGIMSEAKASDAKFDNANLERVSFGQAELFGASFAGAALYGATLQSARIGSDTQFHGRVEPRSSANRGGFEPGRSSGSGTGFSEDASENDETSNNSYILYDPRDQNPVPDGVDSRADNLDKARSVYQTLETVMEQNAYGEKTGTYLLHRKEMERRKHLSEGHTWRYLINRTVYYSCGFGESLRKLFVWALVAPSLLGAIYPVFELYHSTYGPLDYATAGGEALLYGWLFSFSAFTSLGYGNFDVGGVGEVIATFETALGVVWFALLVFVLTKRAER